jgi:uncharacterized protein YaiE (UPF0345 family)
MIFLIIFLSLLKVKGQSVNSSNQTYTNGDGNNWYLNGTGNGPSIMLRQHSGLGGPTNRRGSLSWMDNNSARWEILTWTDAGNIGIGSINPTEKLFVNGNIVSNGNIRSDHGAITDMGYLKGFYSNAGSGIWGFSQNNLFFGGIGGNLYNRGFSVNAMGIFNGSTQKEDIFLYNQNGVGADFLVLKASGNIGIGTTNPETILNIVGGGAAKGVKMQTTSDHATYFESSTNNNTVITRVQSNSNGGFVGTLTNQPFSIVSNGALVINAATSGNIGIGTTTPSEKLSVNGNIRAKKLIVTQNGWPDYVFSKNYKLRSISEVENFINTNKHLPDMPSAKDVEDKGLDIGKMQATLLKKIEELMLYVIELKKENIEIKKDNDQCKRDIAFLRNEKKKQKKLKN